MKKRLLVIICAVGLMALSISLAACGSADVYGDLADDGYTVKVKFEPCGAVVNETQNVTIVEVYNESDLVSVGGKSGIKLLSPEDSRRGDAIFKLAMNDGKSNYFSPGWYKERALRVNDAGEALDAYGEPCAESGREQGYVYSGRWDFENDVLDPKTLENGEFTLYAAWIPFFSYEIYAEGESGEFELLKTVNKLDFAFPEWNERTGKIKMNDMPKVNGMTFYEAYTDSDMTSAFSNAIDGDGSFVNLESGIATQTSVKIYTKWLEGDYIKIFDAEQFAEEIAYDPSGRFILGADIDATEVDLSDVTFTGILLGEGYTVAVSSDVSSADELFGAVGEGALIVDVIISPFSE